MRRVSVLGASCTGKTTVARALALALGVPHVELDALYWGPGWQEATREQMQERVREALAAASQGWVVDGNYHGSLGELVLEQADTVVLLDPPLRVALARALRRTFRRMLTGEELWNGNRERPRFALSRDWIPLWVLRHHRAKGRDLRGRVERHPELDVVHLRSRREVDAWLQSSQASATMSGSSSGSARQKTPPLRET